MSLPQASSKSLHHQLGTCRHERANTNRRIRVSTWLGRLSLLFPLTGCATLAHHPTGYKPANYTLATAGAFGVVWTGYWLSTHNSPLRFDSPDQESLRRHAIFIADHAQPLDVHAGTDYTRLDPKGYESYIQSMIENIKKSHAKQLMIFVHGGLNDITSRPRNSWAIFQEMVRSGDTAAMYPIFVNWESGLEDSYMQHLIHIRQGEYKTSTLWMSMFPYQYAVDFASGVARAPYPMGSALGSMLAANHGARSRLPFRPASAISIDSGQFLPRHSALHPVKEVLRAPLQLTLAPIVGMFGTPAWENMHRRTNELFRQDPDSAHGSFVPADGALAILLQQLNAYLADRSRGPDKMNVVLIGHSMGAIVLTKFIRESPLPISDIVFMAAASTVRQFDEEVLPYLKEHPQTRFYNLTLNRVCEVRETHFGGVSPSGSLLVWLDDYLNRPETPEDHMIGRWTSLPAVLERVPTEQAAQVTFKGFGYRDSTVKGAFGPEHDRPCQHGEFSDPNSHFWKREFWNVRTRDTTSIVRR